MRSARASAKGSVRAPPLESPLPGIRRLLAPTTDSTQTLARKLAVEGAGRAWSGPCARGQGPQDGRRWQPGPGPVFLTRAQAASRRQLADFSLLTAGRQPGDLGPHGPSHGSQTPNDVMTRDPGRPRKVCGILAGPGGCNSLDWLVVASGSMSAHRACPGRAGIELQADQQDLAPGRRAWAFLGEFYRRYNRFY